MPFVILSPAPNADEALGFELRLGPLAFACLAAPLDRTLGEALEAVGSVPTPAEPRPRPLKIVLPVRGTGHEADPAAEGYRLRRQLTQLLENPRILAPGLFFHWAADPELDGWLRFGGGELSESDPSHVLGEWTLTLTDCYHLATPAQGRLARRLELADRRTGLVALDTRGVLYSTDHAAQALPARPLILPGDVTGVLLAYNRPPSALVDGPLRDGRHLWREAAATDGDVASFLPDAEELPDRPYLDLEDVLNGNAGAVRVWDLAGATANPADVATFTPERDANPGIMGWERVYGPMTKIAPQLAIDNGMSRVVWLGNDPAGGLAVEYWDDASEGYVRLGRFNAADEVLEVTIVELTLERAVIEWRAAERAMRVILQRGWYGPRIEAYNDALAGTARLEWAPFAAGAIAITDGAPTWVRKITPAGVVTRTNLVTNPSAEVNTAGVSGVAGGGVTPGAVTRVTTEQKIGVASFRTVTDGSGANQGINLHTASVDVPAGATHAAGAWIKAPVGALVQLELIERTTADAFVSLTAAPIVGNGDWQWASATRAFAAGSTKARIYVRTTGTSAVTFYVDGGILEANRSTPIAATEYFDGDTADTGTEAYAWTGAAHASTSTAMNPAPTTLRFARGRDTDAEATYADGAGTFLDGAGVALTNTAAIVGQLGTPAGPTDGELASLAIADVRPTPLLIRR